MKQDTNHRMLLGAAGEQATVDLISGWGWKVLDRNWRTRAGEIDIVARDGETVVLIEVKTRSSLGFGHPADAVNAAKLNRLRRLLGQWLADHPGVHAPALRIDVSAVVRAGSGWECQYIAGVGQ